MADCQTILNNLQAKYAAKILSSAIEVDQLTVEVDAKDLTEFCIVLRDDPEFSFEMLMDLAGVDYLDYGIDEWTTEKATNISFSRGVEREISATTPVWSKPRFAVVYHLLSIKHNHRIRLRTFAKEDSPIVPSVVNIWNSANWYEREAFDFFGILFDGHPDMRRILTDYGFIGYPFRKDFPLIGNVEVRYSAVDKRVIYEPVSIPPRTLVPKTIRDDHRYLIVPKTEAAIEAQEKENGGN